MPRDTFDQGVTTAGIEVLWTYRQHRFHGRERPRTADRCLCGKQGGADIAHKDDRTRAGDTGVTVNCIAPDAIRTCVFDDWPEPYVQELLSKIPMRRFGTPEELADLVPFIASRQASFSTGAMFDMSGGRAGY